MAIFANKTLWKLIVDSKSDKIELGKHTLKCYGIGKTFEARYRNPITKQLDGLHFFGPLGSKAFSESLIDILVTSSQKSLNMPPSKPEAEPLILPNIQVFVGFMFILHDCFMYAYEIFVNSNMVHSPLSPH